MPKKPKPDHQAERNRINVAAWRERQEKRGKKSLTVWVSTEAIAVLDEFCMRTGKNQSAGLDLLLRSIDPKVILDAKKPSKKKIIDHKSLKLKTFSRDRNITCKRAWFTAFGVVTVACGQALSDLLAHPQTPTVNHEQREY